MAVKPRAKGIPRFTAYASLNNFALNVISGLTTNVAFYATPSPTVIALAAQQVLLAAAIAAWGVVGARGSHAQLMDLRSQSFIMRNMLVQELGYVQNTVVAAGGDYATQSANMVLSGFGVKSGGTPQGILGQPENLHQYFKNSISIYHVGLRWKKPVGVTSPGNVHGYSIFRSLINNFSDPGTSLVGTTSRTAFIDPAPITSTNGCYYWVCANNNTGNGAPTASLNVFPVI